MTEKRRVLKMRLLLFYKKGDGVYMLKDMFVPLMTHQLMF